MLQPLRVIYPQFLEPGEQLLPEPSGSRTQFDYVTGLGRSARLPLRRGRMAPVQVSDTTWLQRPCKKWTTFWGFGRKHLYFNQTVKI